MRQMIEKASGLRVTGNSCPLFTCPYFAIVAGLLLLAGLASQAVAQTVSSTLLGTVTDSSGGHIVGAKLTLSEPSTGQVVRQAVSTATGDYEFDE